MNLFPLQCFWFFYFESSCFYSSVYSAHLYFMSSTFSTTAIKISIIIFLNCLYDNPNICFISESSSDTLFRLILILSFVCVCGCILLYQFGCRLDLFNGFCSCKWQELQIPLMSLLLFSLLPMVIPVNSSLESASFSSFSYNPLYQSIDDMVIRCEW